MIVKDIIGIAYVLLDNASEAELDYAVAVQQYSSVINLMRQEEILGALNGRIVKEEVSFQDLDGVMNNSLTDFGSAVYLEFNDIPVNDCAVSNLDMYKDAGIMRIAFWEDATSGVKKIEQSIPMVGTLKIWYEPDLEETTSVGSTLEFPESLKMCIATRLAAACVYAVHFQDERKEIGKAVLWQSLNNQAMEWKQIYLDKVNRTGLNRPFPRLPFMAQ